MVSAGLVAASTWVGSGVPRLSLTAGSPAAGPAGAVQVSGSLPQAQLRHYSAMAAEARRTVTAVWGPFPPAEVDVVLASAPAEFAHATGETEAGGVAAATVTSGEPRIVVNVTEMGRLSPVGRQVVLTHEMVHVATRTVTTPTVPLWLSEGFAEYVAMTASAVPVGFAVGPLPRGAWSRAALPEAREFTGPDAEWAYARSYLVTRRLVVTYGLDALTRLYPAVASSSLDIALRTELASSVAEVRAGLAADVATLTSPTTPPAAGPRQPFDVHRIGSGRVQQ